MSESATKIVTYQLLDAAGEQTSKAVTYQLLDNQGEQISKMVTYMLLLPKTTYSGMFFAAE